MAKCRAEGLCWRAVLFWGLWVLVLWSGIQQKEHGLVSASWAFVPSDIIRLDTSSEALEIPPQVRDLFEPDIDIIDEHY